MKVEDETRPGEAPAPARRKKERHRAVPLVPEVRFFAPTSVEVRRAATADSAEIVITGAAIVYGAAYRVVDMFGEFRETIHAGAASDLLTRGVDCRLLLNHEGLPMARTTSGTMDLVDDPDALRFVARLDARQQLANDFAVAIERGDLSQMSVGMIVARDDWGSDSGMETRDIYALKDLLDVSGVTYPCSPTTSIEIAHRMAFAAPLESRARLRSMQVELRAGKVLSAANQAKLADALSALHDLANAGGVDPSTLGPGEDEDAPNGYEDGSDSGASAESAAGVVYPDGSGARQAPATATERREASMSYGDRQSAVYAALVASYGDGDGDCDLWICDMGDDWAVYQSYMDPMGLFRCSYTMDGDGNVSLSGEPRAVRVQTSYVPVDDASSAGGSADGDTGNVEARDGDEDAETRDDAPEADTPPVAPVAEPSATMTPSTLRLLVEAGRHAPAAGD